MKDLKRILGYKVLYLREYNKLTQQEFANKLKLNISRGQISNIENATNMPSAEFIRSVCIEFNVTPYWLLDIPSQNISLDPLTDKINLLPKESREIIESLINILLNDTL